MVDGQPARARPRDRPAAKGLSRRQLNRAALERQLLLRRHRLTVEEAVHHSVAVNAQDPKVPYVWAWSRLLDSRRPELTAAIESGRLVRSVVLRATQHLVTPDDFGWLRAAVQPLLARVQRNVFGRRTDGIDLTELVSAARELLSGSTMTRPELGRALDERWPGRDRGALAWSAQYLEPMLHPAPSGTWNVRGATPLTLASDVLGTLDADPDPGRLVRRYLAAYGPATAGDVRTWSGVSGLREAVDSLRGELVTFRDENGRELVDLPDAPRPDADTPAPIRFLPPVDNLMLAYADRTRVMSDDVRSQVCVGDDIKATVLVDGFVRATWGVESPEPATATLVVTAFEPLATDDVEQIEAEGSRLLAFVADDADTHHIRVVGP